MPTNQHGLSRNVPAATKRAIRQRCGFGCVICGLAFYDYEHFDPDFVDAREHNPAGMTLLCPNCNQKRARGRLSAEAVAEANANPRCLQQGFANEYFDFGAEPIEVKFAGSTFYDCRHIVLVDDVPLLSVAPPENPGGPMRLSGRFTNNRGKLTLHVIDNQFVVNTENWDVECINNSIKVRNGRGDIALHIVVTPRHGVSVQRIDMLFRGVHLQGDEGGLSVSIGGKPGIRSIIPEARHCFAGFFVESDCHGYQAANDSIFDTEM